MLSSAVWCCFIGEYIGAEKQGQYFFFFFFFGLLLTEEQSRSVELYSEEQLCVRERAEKQIILLRRNR